MTTGGFLVIDKPDGMTSHTVVNRVRRITGEKKCGHTGTLDPFATGVLPVAVGEATKVIQFLDESVKEYRAVMRLGEATDTQDYTGNIIFRGDWHGISPTQLETVSSQFIGVQQQTPPMFSAIKQNGVPLYRLARKGEEVERQPRTIEIHALTIEKVELPEVTFLVRCSRGTYVRTLAHDMGKMLGAGAHLTVLCRTRSGPFGIYGAVSLEVLEEAHRNGDSAKLLLPPLQILTHLPVVELEPFASRTVIHGVAPGKSDIVSGWWPDIGSKVVLTGNGELLAVAEADVRGEGETLRLLRVFH